MAKTIISGGLWQKPHFNDVSWQILPKINLEKEAERRTRNLSVKVVRPWWHRPDLFRISPVHGLTLSWLSIAVISNLYLFFLILKSQNFAGLPCILTPSALILKFIPFCTRDIT